MKFIILHDNRNNSCMLPLDRICFMQQTEHGARVAVGNRKPYESLCVKETVEEIARKRKEAADI